MDLELITTSGYGKNGALTFLQRTVRPQIVTTFQLPGIREAWTVRGPLNSDNVRMHYFDNLRRTQSMIAYMILTEYI